MKFPALLTFPFGYESSGHRHSSQRCQVLPAKDLMRVTCPSCQTNYNIDDKRIPSGGAKLKCAKCQTLFAINAATPGGPVPLPGAPAPPGRGSAGSVPLPSSTGAREAVTIQESSIPLPGTGLASSPGGAAGAPGAAKSRSVPLPSNSLGRTAKFEEGLTPVDFPGNEPPAAAAPQPGQSRPKPIALPGLNTNADDFDLFGDAEQRHEGNPPAETESAWPALDSPDQASEAESPAFPETFDFAEPSAPAAHTKPDLDFDFASPSDAPAGGQGGPAVATGVAPPPRASDPPSADLNFEMADVSTNHGPPTAADAFDFGDPPGAAIPDDGTAAESEHSGRGSSEDFAAQMADSPAHESPGQVDENLEMLSFVDKNANDDPAEKTSALRYHLRRKTGKVFGPFDQSIVSKMLQDGQLTGTEDLSADQLEWFPIASVPAFREVIASLANAPPPQAPAPEDGSGQVDHLKRLYEGRMAAVNVIRTNSVLDLVKERAKLLIAAGAVLFVIAAGASLGFTRYGAFGLRRMFSTHVSRSSPQFAMLENARKGFLADTYKSYRESFELAAAVLKVRDYPEARAVWCQSVFYLQRRFSAAKPADVMKASASLEDIELLGRKDLDLIKATAGARLAEGKAPQAVAILQEAVSRTENAADLELSLLLAEAYAQQGQARLALETLTKAVDRHKDSARALHALGNVYQASNEVEKAAKAYSGALEADPDHLSSAVELAAIGLLPRNDPAKALEVLELPSGDKGQVVLGPIELARTHALKGAALEAQSKTKEAIPELEQALKLDSTSAFAKEKLAHLLLMQHEFAKALPLYKEVVDKEPQNLGATEGYLTSLIGLTRMDDALKALAQANARFPGKARIAYLDGRVNDALDKTSEAEAHYQRAINADPKLTDATLYLARLYLRLRRVGDTKALLEQALAQAPSDARVRAAVGELAMLESDLPRARAAFQKAVELDAGLAEGHLGLSKVALEDGALETSRAEVEKALDLNAHVKDGRLQHGLVLWRMRQLDEAVSELEKAKAEDPRANRTTILLGAVLLDKGDLANAEINLIAALAVEPINAEGHFYLGKVKNRRGEYSQAIDSMRNALDRAPNRPDYLYEMGIVYRDAKRTTEAIQMWKRAVELDPTQANSLEALGQAYLDRGEFDRAIAAFEQTLHVDHKRTQVLAMIGDCHFQAGKWDQAIAAYLGALKTDASLKQIFYKLGRAYTEKGNHAQAINWYRKAIAEDATKPMAFYYLGYAYKEKRHKKEAIEAFRSYLTLKTDAEDKKDIEDEIYDLEHD